MLSPAFPDISFAYLNYSFFFLLADKFAYISFGSLKLPTGLKSTLFYKQKQLGLE